MAYVSPWARGQIGAAAEVYITATATPDLSHRARVGTPQDVKFLTNTAVIVRFYFSPPPQRKWLCLMGRFVRKVLCYAVMQIRPK